MAQTARYFDSVLYTEAEYAEVQNRLLAEGIIRGVRNEFSVSAPGGMAVRVASGEAMIQGFWYKNDANLDLAVAANSSGSTRTDAVFLRLNRVTNLVELVVVTNAGAPIRTEGGDWEMQIATIAVPNGAGAITSGMITDTRSGAFCGWTGTGVVSRGTNSVVSLSVGGDPDSGINFPTATTDTVDIVTAATTKARFTSTGVSIGTDAAVASMVLGRAGLNTTIAGSLVSTGAIVLQPTSGGALMTIASPDGGQDQVWLTNNTQTKQGFVGLGTAASQMLGGSGDLNVYTAGSGAGRLILGASSVAKITMDASQVTFMHAGTVHGLLNSSTGRWVFGPSLTPATKVHVISESATDGLTISPAAAATANSPMLTFWDRPSGVATMQGLLGLALATGHFNASSLAGDVWFSTAGSAAGRLLFGTAGALRAAIRAAGGVDVYQASEAVQSGVNLRHTNGSVYSSWWVNTAGHSMLSISGTTMAIAVHPSTGYVTIGTSIQDNARLSILQASDVAAEGIRLAFGGGFGRSWVDANGWYRFDANSNNGFAVMHGAHNVVPPTDQATTLGHASFRWAHLYAMGATFAGPISGITTVGASGAVSAGSFSTAGAMASGSVATGSVTCTSVALTGTGTVNGAWNPLTDTNYSLGEASKRWNAVYAMNGYKPGGGSWVDPSDLRTKVKSSIRPYDRGLETVMALRPVYYRQNGDYGTMKDGEFVGVVANDVADIVPEMVRTDRRRRRSEDDPEEDILIWDSSNMPYMLVRAVQELKAEIDDLRKQLAERKN